MADHPDPRTLLDLAQDKVVVIDERGVCQYANAAVEDLLGFDPDDLVGRNAFSLVHPEDEPRLRSAFEAIVAGEEEPTETLEYRYRTADDGWLWMESEVHIPAETGLDGYVLSSRDISKEVESIRRLETIVSGSPDVLWMFDAEWTELLFVNDSIEDVYGFTADELDERPRRFLDVIHSDDRARVERAMERLSAGEQTRIDYRIEPVPGVLRWLRVPADPVVEDGRVVAITGFARDVTDEYRRNRQLAVMDNLLRHTIRNDMNVVMGTAERIAERTADRTDSDLATDAQTIRRVAAKLLETAEKQRDVIELLNQGGSPQVVDVTSLVEDVVAEARATSPNGEFTVDCPGESTALALPELEFAVVELVENAVEHAESPPLVSVEVRVADDSVSIAVRDNCPPIPPEERQVITGRLQMDDLHHTVGMGLWLVYWVTERSGGSLSFDTHSGGNVVTITVPNATGGAVERAHDAWVNVAGSPVEQRFGLVAGDDRAGDDGGSATD